MDVLFLLLLPFMMLQLGGAQIYLQCDDTEFTNIAGCSCWNPQNPIISCTSLGLNVVPKIQKAHTLDLSNNRLSYITENSFKKVNGLKRLISSNNVIQALHFRAFRNQVGSSLELLDLDHNLVDKIPDMFSGRTYVMANLTVLRLSHNSIYNIKARAFVGAPNLLELYLNGNPINRILPSAWDRISNLHQLELSAYGMDIYMIPSENLRNLTSLRLIGIRSQRLDFLAPWFETFTLLQDLTLENMGLRDDHFCKGQFPQAWGVSLRRLSFTGNELTTIPYHIMQLPALRYFDISRNWIKRIEYAISRSEPHTLIQLHVFNASDNIIDFINSKQLLSLGNAKVIDISKNRLSKVYFTMREIQNSLQPNVVFYVDENPWDCSVCYNKWLIGLIHSNQISRQELTSTYRCGPGGTYGGDLIADIPIGQFCKK